MTVAATAEPSSLKCWSMPSFRPISTGFAIAGAAWSVGACSSTFVSSGIPMPSLELDLDVDARRKVELHERVDRLLPRVVDVDEPLVGPHLPVCTRGPVHERDLDH